jgi:lipopolysaccharide transport system ATP-binding protein
MAGLKVRGLQKGFQVYARPSHRFWARLSGRPGLGRSIRALAEVSFDLESGRTLGIVGRNGSGKSTLLRLLAGAMLPDAGSLEGPARVASLLELGGAFNREETGRRNVELAWILRGLSRAERRERMGELIEFSGLGSHLDLPLKHYSGGQFLRLAFSEAMLWEPELLILDEVMAVGDADFQARCLERIQVLKTKGVAVVLATHDLAFLRHGCDQAIWLEEGFVRAQGSGDQVAKAYAGSFL